MGYYLTTIIEWRIIGKKKKSDIELDESLSISSDIELEESLSISSDIELEESLSSSPDFELEESLSISPDFELEENLSISPDFELEENLSISPPVETNTQYQVPSYPSRQEKDKSSLTDYKLVKQRSELLEWAIQSSQKVQFDYGHHDSSKSHHAVTPIQLLTIEGDLCLEAYCCLKKSKRVFEIEFINKIIIESPNEISNNTLPLSKKVEKSKPPSLRTTTRNTGRIYFRHSTNDLERIAKSNWNSVDVLNNIHYELSFRSRQKAYRLRKKISNRLSQFQSTQFVWPTTTASTGSQNLSNDAFKYEKGLLSHCGYKVGIHGLEKGKRLKILDSIFLHPLMQMDNYEYLDEWGEPRTSRRLQKLAESIAAFTRNAKRRNNRNFRKAIEDWEADLAYLKKTYYYKHFSFRWPHT